MADTWTVTAWRCECHGYAIRQYTRDQRWYVFDANRIRVSGVPFETVTEIREHHTPLIPLDVDDVPALLADVYEATSRALPVLLHAWDGIATALGLATLTPAESTPVGGE